MARTSMPTPTLLLRSLALALAGLPWSVAAQTQVPVRAGTPALNATVTTPAAGQLLITQTRGQTRAYVEWRDFSVGPQATVTVSQGSTDSVLLNRVVDTGGGAIASRIEGRLLADTTNGVPGHVYLLNPAGIVFGGGAQVQLGSLVAAALDTRTSGADFIAGQALDLVAGSGRIGVEAGATLDLRGPALPSSGDQPGRVVLIGGGGLTMDGVLRTAGGAAWLGVAQGGSLPATGVPIGNSGFITLQLTPAATGTLAMGGRIDLAAAAVGLPDGTVTMRAPDLLIGNRSGVTAPPLLLAGAQLDAIGRDGPGSLLIDGGADAGTAVLLRNVTLSGARVEIRGVSVAGAPNADAPTYGVQLDNVAIAVGAGRLVVAGRGENTGPNAAQADAIGVGLSGLQVTTAAGGGQSVVIVGESVGSTGAGIVAINDGLNSVGSANPTAGASAAGVVFGASAGAAGQAWQLFGPPSVRTTGTVQLVPLGVGRDGQIVARSDQAIAVGGAASPSATGFHVPVDWLRDAQLNQGSGFDTPALVIGSATHAGAITASGDVMSARNVASLTLQNGAATSAGIQIGAGASGTDPARGLTLISGGPITQTGDLAVGHLQLGGRPDRTDVRLDRAGNRVDRLSFVDLRSLQLDTAGTLTVAAGTLLGDDGAGGTAGTLAARAPNRALAATRLGITTSTATDRVLLRVGGGDLVLEQGIRTTASGSRIDLVSSGLFQNPGNASLSTGSGGVWRVWSSTATGGSRGSLPASATLATRYGCVFGDSGSCALSRASLPTSGSGFLYAVQPDLLIVPVPLTAPRGTLLPPLTFGVSGLLNGDAAAAAVAGAPGTTATLLSAPGRYAIVNGTLNSPTGYRLVLDASAASALTIAPPNPLRSVYADGLARLLAASTSETHGRNLATPGTCAAAGDGGRAGLLADAGADLLGLEWRRVRAQPQFSSCVDVDRGGGACAGF